MYNMKLIVIIFLIKWITVFTNKKDVIARYSTGGSNLKYLKWNTFIEPKKESRKRVDKWNRGYKENLLGAYVEGEILRNGVISKSRRWPYGIVVYEFSNNVNFIQRFAVLRAMIAFRKNTCVRFRKKNWRDEDYIFINTTDDECCSLIGRIGGKQTVNLESPNCFKSGSLIHELMHVIGFAHEQSRYDRDEYVKVILENVQPDQKHNFNKVDRNKFSDLGLPYDYRSIMHYSNYAFTKNDLETMVAKDGVHKLGLATYFSELDLKKVRKMYTCRATTAYSNELVTFLIPLIVFYKL